MSATRRCKRITSENLVSLSPIDSVDRVSFEAGEARLDTELLLFLETDRAMDVDQAVQASFCIPFDVYRYRALGRVAWVTPRPDGTRVRGIGVRVVQAFQEPVLPAVRSYLEGEQPETRVASKPDAPAPEPRRAAPASTADESASPAGEAGGGLARLPEAIDLRQLLEGVFDSPPAVRALETDGDLAPVLCTSFGEDDGRAEALCIANLEFCSYAGGAMVLVPAEDVRSAVEDGVLDENVAEFLPEVFRIFEHLLAAERGSSLRVLASEFVESQDVAALAEPLGPGAQRRDYEIEVPGYGVGCLAILVRRGA